MATRLSLVMSWVLGHSLQYCAVYYVLCHIHSMILQVVPQCSILHQQIWTITLEHNSWNRRFYSICLFCNSIKLCQIFYLSITFLNSSCMHWFSSIFSFNIIHDLVSTDTLGTEFQKSNTLWVNIFILISVLNSQPLFPDTPASWNIIKSHKVLV